MPAEELGIRIQVIVLLPVHRIIIESWSFLWIVNHKQEVDDEAFDDSDATVGLDVVANLLEDPEYHAQDTKDILLLLEMPPSVRNIDVDHEEAYQQDGDDWSLPVAEEDVVVQQDLAVEEDDEAQWYSADLDVTVCHTVQQKVYHQPKCCQDGAVAGKRVVLHPDSFECLKLFIGVVSHGDRQLDNLNIFLSWFCFAL